MKSEGCTVQQALTTEAAMVVKNSLSLARRRSHAQVTPLHVAATLLTSTREAGGLFRRACLRSHPLHPNSHPLQCRALELCFNVALNRLPTITPPPSPSGHLIPTHPSLSNALIAALKRAQAHQRRGSIEQQQHNQQQQYNQQQQHNQQQQPLLAAKVELEQLIISILNDPSVSRVMKEAGFSSTCIKNNLEDDTFCSSSPSSVFFDTQRQNTNHGSFLRTHHLKPPLEHNPPLFSSPKDDLTLIFRVLLGKNKKRTNIVVVGDSDSYTDGLMSKLMSKVERGDLPKEFRYVQLIRLHFSSLQLSSMSKSDIEIKVSDLRRKVIALTSQGRNVILYLGDLKWAVDDDGHEETSDGRNGTVRYLIRELGRLQCDWNSFHECSNDSRVWLMAIATYRTYMSCQMRQPFLEVQWGLQAVAVPSGGLSLTLHVPSSSQESRLTIAYQNPFQTWEAKSYFHINEQERLICCPECTSNFEKEALSFKLGYKNETGTNNSSASLPSWIQPQKHPNHHEDPLVELRRKWNMLCQRLQHHNGSNQIQMYPSLFPSFSKKSYNCGSFASMGASSRSSINFSNFMSQPRNLEGGVVSLDKEEPLKQWAPKLFADIRTEDDKQDLTTTLALGSSAFSESLPSKEQKRIVETEQVKLLKRLKENIPWLSDTLCSISEELVDPRPGDKGTWFLIRGTDDIGKRRLSMVIVDYVCNPISSLVHINASKFENTTKKSIRLLMEALQGDASRVVLIEEIGASDDCFLKFLYEGFETGSFTDSAGRSIRITNTIFILTLKSDDASETKYNVVEMRLQREEIADDAVATRFLKRKAEPFLSIKQKNHKTSGSALDLNIKVHDPEEEEDHVLSDLTEEITNSTKNTFPDNFLSSISSSFVLDSSPDHLYQISEYYVTKINQAFEEVRSQEEAMGCLFSVDDAVLEKLITVSGSFLDDLFNKWLKEVLRTCLASSIKNGGNVRLCLVDRVENDSLGFKGSCLPNRIHVD